MKLIIAAHARDHLFDERPANPVALSLIQRRIKPIIHKSHIASTIAVVVVETEANLVVRHIPRHDATVNNRKLVRPHGPGGEVAKRIGEFKSFVRIFLIAGHLI